MKVGAPSIAHIRLSMTHKKSDVVDSDTVQSQTPCVTSAALYTLPVWGITHTETVHIQPHSTTIYCQL